jgi:hypothetical protein
MNLLGHKPSKAGYMKLVMVYTKPTPITLLDCAILKEQIEYYQPDQLVLNGMITLSAGKILEKLGREYDFEYEAQTSG